MRCALYAGEASEEYLQRYGLGVPDRTITFMLSDSLLTGFDRQGAQTTSRAIPAQQLRIALGEGIGNIGLYCLYEGKIYQASNASMGFLRDSTLERLSSPTPVNRRYRFDTALGRRVLALFHYDALHYAMRVNGVFADYVLRESADSIAL